MIVVLPLPATAIQPESRSAMIHETSIDPSVFLAPDADVLGRVHIAADCSVWFRAVIRAEAADIVIGPRTNIQDGCILHVDADCPMTLGSDVTVGHGAILHGCSIGDNTLIGMGAIVLNGAAIGKNCIVGAGALVTQGTVVPDNTLVLGSPAKPIRTLTEEQIAKNLQNAAHYVKEGAAYKQRFIKQSSEHGGEQP